MTLKLLTSDGIKAILDRKALKHEGNYWGFYSSVWQGVSLDPRLMLIPVDDHLVHRGDGVFEALKITNGGIYLLEPHLRRLLKSAERISLKHDYHYESLRETVLQTARMVLQERRIKDLEEVKSAPSGLELRSQEASLRIFLTRGSGSFGTNPADSTGAQLFVIVTAPATVAEDKRKQGVSCIKSHIPVKPDWFAQVKSCNYLPNVLMKQEAVLAGVDFTLAFDEKGHLAEGSTENVAWISRDGVLCHPPLDRILKGTTMTRVFDLAEMQNLIPVQREAQAQERDLLEAQDVFMIGTTLDVLAVKSYEQKIWTDFSWAQKLRELLLQDQKPGSSAFTSL
jgi:branched-chain amino acid aminotransferase